MVSLNNSSPNRKLTMSMVKDALFNEEAWRREIESDESRTLVLEGSRERGRSHQRCIGRGRPRSQSRSLTFTCFYCDQDGHIKRNYPKYKANVKND